MVRLFSAVVGMPVVPTDEGGRSDDAARDLRLFSAIRSTAWGELLSYCAGVESGVAVQGGGLWLTTAFPPLVRDLANKLEEVCRSMVAVGRKLLRGMAHGL